VTSVAEQPQRLRVDLQHSALVFPAGQARSGSSCVKDAQRGVASIRSVHGKRLTSSVPLDELFSTPTTTPAGTAELQRRTYDQRPSFTSANDAGRRSSVDCCRTVTKQSLLASFTQRALDDNSVLSSVCVGRISPVSGITRVSLVTDGAASLSDTDHDGVQSYIADVKDARGFSECVTSSAAEGPSRHGEFVGGRRRRPVSVMEFTSPALPPPRARKPPLPDHLYSQTHASKPMNHSPGEQLQRLTATRRVNEDVTLRDARQSNLTRDSDSVTAARSLEYSVPVALQSSSDMTPGRHTTDNSVRQKTSSVNRPHSQYAVPSAGPPLVEGPEQSEGVCTDVGSFAQRLSQLRTLYHEGPGSYRAQAVQPANCTVNTAGEFPPRDAVTRPERCPNQQDSVFTDLPASATVRGSEIGDLAEFDESLNRENNTDDVAVSDDLVLFPPPPEFDDSFTAMTSSSSGADQSDSVTDTRSRNIDDWSADEVCSWLDDVGLCQHCTSFTTRNVNGVHLRTLGRSELIALGLTDVHDRMTFERALRKLLKS